VTHVRVDWLLGWHEGLYTVLRVDPLAQRVAALFQFRVAFERSLVAFGVKDLGQLSKQGRQFAVLTAYRPPEEGGKHTNKERQSELLRDLQKMGYRKVVPLKSSWEDMASGKTHGERSVLVPNMSFEHATALMKKYNQDGIVYKDPSGTVGIYTKNGKAQMAYDPKSGDPAISKALDKSEYSKGRSLSFGLQLVDGEFDWSSGPVTAEHVKKHIEGEEPKTESSKDEGSDWWDSQTSDAKRKYLDEHPNSALSP
jgi:hypothetical protein